MTTGMDAYIKRLLTLGERVDLNEYRRMHYARVFSHVCASERTEKSRFRVALARACIRSLDAVGPYSVDAAVRRGRAS